MEHLAHARFADGLVGADLLSLMASLFLAGLVGGVTHCAGMCGPFVLAQVTATLDTSGRIAYGALERLSGAALAPYHLGRITTYTGLGALAGGIAGSLSDVSGLSSLIAIPLALAALFFLLQAIGRSEAVLSGWLPNVGIGESLAGFVAPLASDPRGWSGYGLGLALGFLPCGLLYGALVAAAGGGGLVQGAGAMAAFTLGTVPGLIGVGYVGQLFARRWQVAAAVIGRLVMLINAVLLASLAARAATG